MIIYMLLKAILFVFKIVASIFGSLIPNFPSAISNVLTTISTMLQGGIGFLSYFFHPLVFTGTIELILTWHVFCITKDGIMKVIGHFFAN